MLNYQRVSLTGFASGNLALSNPLFSTSGWMFFFTAWMVPWWLGQWLVAAGGQTKKKTMEQTDLFGERFKSWNSDLFFFSFFPTIVFFCISFNIHITPFSMDDRRSIFLFVVTCLHPALPWRATWHKLICHPWMMKARKSFLERPIISSGSFDAWSGLNRGGCPNFGTQYNWYTYDIYAALYIYIYLDTHTYIHFFWLWLGVPQSFDRGQNSCSAFGT